MTSVVKAQRGDGGGEVDEEAWVEAIVLTLDRERRRQADQKTISANERSCSSLRQDMVEGKEEKEEVEDRKRCSVLGQICPLLLACQGACSRAARAKSSRLVSSTRSTRTTCVRLGPTKVAPHGAAFGYLSRFDYGEATR